MQTSDRGTDHIFNDTETTCRAPLLLSVPPPRPPSHHDLANTAGHKVFIYFNKYLVKKEKGNNHILVEVGDGEDGERIEKRPARNFFLLHY